MKVEKGNEATTDHAAELYTALTMILNSTDNRGVIVAVEAAKRACSEYEKSKAN